MIYFDKDKKAFGFEIQNPICVIDDLVWAQHAGSDNPKSWDIVNNTFVDLRETEEYKNQIKTIEIKKEISEIESQITSRRLREAALGGQESIDFIQNIENQIAALTGRAAVIYENDIMGEDI
jgi:hypothetical protein